jgi:hypothetical protein
MAQVPRRTYVLIFDGSPGDEDLDEFEIKVRPPSVGESLEHHDMAWFRDPATSEAERTKRLAELYAVFAARLVSWNLEDGDRPLPATLEGLHQLPQDVGGRILGSWLWETATVPRPLPHDSNTGGTSVDESQIPMGALPDLPS